MAGYGPAMNEVITAVKVKHVGGPFSNGDFLIKCSPPGIGQLEADRQTE